MRELILKRILEIKKNSDNFNQNVMRWKNFFVINDDDNEKIHISKFDFKNLSDEELLKFFELLIRRISKVM